jgi:hypothetical protein
MRDLFRNRHSPRLVSLGKRILHAARLSSWWAALGGRLLISCAVLIPSVLTGCGQSNPFPNVRPVSAKVRAEINKYCVLCHGERGDGQGIRTATLSKKPRDWTDMDWQLSISDEEIGRVIVQGGSATGRSNDMPSFSYLKDSPELAEYINAVRAFAVFPPE